jgi:hypothetical protein
MLKERVMTLKDSLERAILNFQNLAWPIGFEVASANRFIVE